MLTGKPYPVLVEPVEKKVIPARRVLKVWKVLKANHQLLLVQRVTPEHRVLKVHPVQKVIPARRVFKVSPAHEVRKAFVDLKVSQGIFLPPLTTPSEKQKKLLVR
jgi:hypothetical protein